MKHSHLAKIQDVLVDNTESWQSKILSQLLTYKKAPFYHRVRRLVEGLLTADHRTIASLNKSLLEGVCNYLGIPRTFEIVSEMDLQIDEPGAPDEWALMICKALGDVSEYWNPAGGQSFFDRSKYEAAGIRLRFHAPVLSEYDQGRSPFEPGLSIIDVLMFNDVPKVHDMLDRYELT